MNLWQRSTQALGALPARRVTWVLAIVFSLWAVADMAYFKVSSGLAQNSYDAMVRARLYAPPADPRILIIDIDEASLSRMAGEFGRWPWPRDTLATVLDYVEKQAPAAVVWDVLFADPDRLSPGGDKAFDEAAKRSAHSHFPVVRLPAANDGKSKLSRSNLPNLWLPSTDAAVNQSTQTLAVIPPFLASIANSRLGYNNGYPDSDGVLRRYRYVERLPGGGVIQSIPVSVARSLNTAQMQNTSNLIAEDDAFTPTVGKKILKDKLMVWRKNANAYPRVAFADVFNAAEGGKPLKTLPDFKGKIIVIGSTAPSLHDIHPTPLAPAQAGVDSLATAIDNAVNGHFVAELPRWLQAGLAVLMCVLLAYWVSGFQGGKGLASLDPALLILPAALLAISFASLNGTPLFVDLQLAAGTALLFLAALRTWNGWRRDHWCGYSPTPEALIGVHASQPLAGVGLDRLIGMLAKYAPACRVVAGDASATWPASLRWSELARFCAVCGPTQQLAALAQAPWPDGTQFGATQILANLPADNPQRSAHIAQAAVRACAAL